MCDLTVAQCGSLAPSKCEMTELHGHPGDKALGIQHSTSDQSLPFLHFLRQCPFLVPNSLSWGSSQASPLPGSLLGLRSVVFSHYTGHLITCLPGNPLTGFLSLRAKRVVCSNTGLAQYWDKKLEAENFCWKSRSLTFLTNIGMAAIA